MVVLALFVFLSVLTHHAGYAIEVDFGTFADHGRQLSATELCHDDHCVDQHGSQVGCCASGNCGAPLPAPGCVAGLVLLAPAYLSTPALVGPRWANPGLDRPPKAPERSVPWPSATQD